MSSDSYLKNLKERRSLLIATRKTLRMNALRHFPLVITKLNWSNEPYGLLYDSIELKGLTYDDDDGNRKIDYRIPSPIGSFSMWRSSPGSLSSLFSSSTLHSTRLHHFRVSSNRNNFIRRHPSSKTKNVVLYRKDHCFRGVCRIPEPRNAPRTPRTRR